MQSQLKNRVFMEEGGRLSIGLAYPQVLEVLHTHTLTPILAQKNFPEGKLVNDCFRPFCLSRQIPSVFIQ